MPNKNNVLSRTTSYYAILASLSLAVWLILRLVLSLQVGWGQMTWTELAGTFALGLWFDLATLAYLLAPLLLLSALSPASSGAKSWLNAMCWLATFVLTFALIFGAVSEFIFWQEFSTRFNFIAVDYLVYTHEVIGNIRESYPVPLIVLAIAVLVLIILYAVSLLVSFSTAENNINKRVMLFASAVLLPLLSYEFANLDQMQFSKNTYANELAGNGVFSFSAAARRNELDYDAFYKKIPQTQADKILKQVGVTRRPSSVALNDDRLQTQH